MIPLKIRSMVGLIPLFAVETLEPDLLAQGSGISRHGWNGSCNYRPDLAALVSRWQEPRSGERHLLSLLRGSRMKKLLRRMLDETEFLSDYGMRAISQHPSAIIPTNSVGNGNAMAVSYQPGESTSGMFGGNSNWRGPIWFPVNYLIIESLQKFHHYYGDEFKIECPTGSGHMMTINEVAAELSRRLLRVFLPDGSGNRPVFGRLPEDAEGSAFPRPSAVLRILPWRHRPRRRRQSSDRMDRPDRQTRAAAQPFQGALKHQEINHKEESNLPANSEKYPKAQLPAGSHCRYCSKGKKHW